MSPHGIAMQASEERKADVVASCIFIVDNSLFSLLVHYY
jgi:hypothetical protein